MRHQLFNFATVVVKQVAELQAFSVWVSVGQAYVFYLLRSNLLGILSGIYLPPKPSLNLPGSFLESRIFCWGRIPQKSREPGTLRTEAELLSLLIFFLGAKKVGFTSSRGGGFDLQFLDLLLASGINGSGSVTLNIGADMWPSRRFYKHQVLSKLFFFRK